jgi:hypothetical protein
MNAGVTSSIFGAPFAELTHWKPKFWNINAVALLIEYCFGYSVNGK